MDFVQEMKKKANALQNTLVLPEGTEERTIIAAAKIIADKIASKVTLLGNVDKISFTDFVSYHIYHTFISFVCFKLFHVFGEIVE